MRILKLLAIGWVVILFLTISSGYGNEWNKKTVLKLTEPMQIEGVLLQPGTYVFRLMDSKADRHIVRIMNEDETQVVATIIGMPHYELGPPNKSQTDFWEAPAVTPPAVKTWHYPGEMLGLQFTPAPPTQVAAPTPPAPAPPAAEAPAPAPAPEAPAPPETAEAQPAPAPPQEAPAPAPAPVETLPKTASALPLIALIGLIFVAISLVLRRLGNQTV
jgi:hypothetical protein